MSSLRARLVVSVVLVVGLTLSLFSVVLSVAFRRGLEASFAERLDGEARSLAAMVEEHATSWEFEVGRLEAYAAGPEAAYFEIWLDDGTVLARSESLEAGTLPRHEGPLSLPDGRPGRLHLAALPPRQPEDAPPVPTGRQVLVAVARSTAALEANLALLRELLVLAGALALICSALGVWLLVRRAVRPVEQLAARLDQLDATRLAERVSSAEVPLELKLAVDKVNELLARLEAAFARLREFNADVSHELRTPLAGLKVILEVAASKDRDGPAYRRALAESLEVVAQLERLVESLLLLSRLDAGHEVAKHEPIGLRSFVDDCFAPFAEEAARRGLRFTNTLGPELEVQSDRARLRMIVSNLLSNAVAYTTPGGCIRVDAPASTLVRVSDSGPPLAEADLERIFLPFVRLELGRGGTGTHHGIGLALVRTLCASLRLGVRARNDGEWLAFEVLRSTAEPA